MRAHATQITVDEPFFALSNQVRQRALGSSTTPCWAPAAAGDRDTELF